MTLVDKLVGVQRGDIILLRDDAGLEVAGIVQDYGAEEVRLSTTSPHNATVSSTGGIAEYFKRWRVGTNKPNKTYQLKDFDDFSILRRYN